MRAPALATLLLVLTAVTATSPAVAEPPVVGYLPPGIEYGGLEGSDLPTGEVRAQGVVVSNLEPAASGAGLGPGCPDSGCSYALVVLDPAAVRDPGTAGCAADQPHGVVDDAPEEAPLGSGARVLTGRGPVPAEPVDEPAGAPHRLAEGVGLLCFAASGPGGPTAVTQPAPIVLLQPPPP